MSKTELENYQPSNSPRGAKLKCTTEVCELYGGGKQKVREREQGKEDDVSLRKKKSKEGASRSRKQQQHNTVNDSEEQSNADERTTEREVTSRSGSMKKSKKSSKHPVPENENSPPPKQKDKKSPKIQEEKIINVNSGEATDSAVTPVKQSKTPKEKALSKSFKKQMKEKEKSVVNKQGKHTEHDKDDDTTPARRGKLLQSGPPTANSITEGERNSTSEKKIQKESKLEKKEKEKDSSAKKKETNAKELILSSSSVTPQPQQSNMRSAIVSEIERKPTNSNKHHNSDDYQNHFNNSSKEFISTKTQEFYFDNPNSNDVRENHEVMEEFPTLRPKHQESRKTVRNPSYSASTKTINVEKLLQDDEDGVLLKENKVDKRQMDPRTNDLDELVQIPLFGMMMNMDDAKTPATACASTMTTTRPRKVIRNKPSPNNSSSSNNNPTTTSNNSNTNNQGKTSRTKTSGKSSSKASRKHSRIDGAKNGGGGVNSNVLVNGTKQLINTSEYYESNSTNNNQSQHQHLQQAQNQSQSGIKHSKSQHYQQQQQRQNQQQQQNQNFNIIMGNEVLGSSNISNVTSSGKNHTKEPSVTTSSSLKPSVQNSSSFRRKNHTGPPTTDRVRKWRKGTTNIEKEKEYTTSAEILAAVQQQLALADLNHGSQGKPLHGRFNPVIYNLSTKLDKNNMVKGGGVNGNGQINYSTNNVNLNTLVTPLSPPVRTPPGKSSRLMHPNLRKMSRISHFYANNDRIANSNTNSSNNTGGVINIPGGGILTLPTSSRVGKFSSGLNKRTGAKLNNSLAKREPSLKNVERGAKKIDSWNYHGHSRDVTSDSGTVIDIRKELKGEGLWYGGGVKEFSF